ncbi:uncharacterized protein LOC141536430 isoform X2 [Cotesia typhae]|uniref:uncharacterized protein LOC141536430 isoform X2 n=1 Tax=Cotesia typhae TaxID=2053667 RepID=UPI003D69DF1D
MDIHILSKLDIGMLCNSFIFKYLYCKNRSRTQCPAHGIFRNGIYTPSVKKHTCRIETNDKKQTNFSNIKKEKETNQAKKIILKPKEAKMPPVSRLPRSIAIDITFKYVDNFTEESLPPWSSEIWKKMSKDSGEVWNNHAWFTNVREDRRGILTEARKRAGLPPIKSRKAKKPESDEESFDGDDIYDSDYVDEFDTDKESWFELILTHKQWSEIKPPDGIELKKPPLRKNVWTNIIAITFWEQHGLPCAYVFKKGYVNKDPTSKYFIEINGKCRSKLCGNKFYAVAEMEPEPNESLCLRVRTRNTTMEDHEDVKRPLNGERRREFAQAAVIEGTTNLKKRLEFTMPQKNCPLIPNTSTISTAKKQLQDECLDSGVKINLKADCSNILINNNHNIKNNNNKESIDVDKDIDAPFLILLSTPEQSQYYRDCCHLDNVRAVGIDKKGNLIPFV